MRRAMISILLATGLNLVAVGNDMDQEEFESAAYTALTNKEFLLGTLFSNKLDVAESSSALNVRVDSALMKGVRARQMFFESADSEFLDTEMAFLSNAVSLTSFMTNNWRKYIASLMYAGCHATVNSFDYSYGIITNTMAVADDEGFNGTTNQMCMRILSKFQMTGLSVNSALNLMAGMSAAELGMGNVATNYANQLPATYRNMIFDFMR